jgi:AcrR family transcriptional regulator
LIRDAESASARDRILAVAGQLFAERGFDAVAVADIAQASSISTGLIYYHFKDKQTLYETSIREGLHLFEDAGIRALTGEAPAIEKLRGFVAEYMELVEQHSSIMRMLIRGVSDLTGPAPRNLIMRSAVAIDRLEAVITDGIAEGSIRPLDARLAALSLFALVNTPITARSLETALPGTPHLSAEDQAAFVTDLFLEGIASC